MKKFLLPLLAVGVCASASALTVDELCKKRAAIVLQGNDMQLSFPVASSGAYFTKVDNNTVLLNNIYDGLGRNMKLDAKGNLTLDLYNGVAGPFNWGTGWEDMYGIMSMCRVVQAQYQYDGETALLICWQYGMLDEEIPCSQYVDDNGTGVPGMHGWGFNHRTKDAAILIEWVKGKQNSVLMDIQCFNGFTMYAFDCNATAVEYAGNGIADVYPVDVTIYDNGDFTVKNFLNQGMSYSVDVNKLQYGINWVYGSMDKETGEVVIPIQYTAGTADFGFLGDGSAYDTFLGDGKFFSDGPTGYWFVYDGTTYYPWQIIDSSTFTGDSAAPISGMYYTGAAEHQGYSRWVSNDGDCTTNVTMTMDLGSTGIYASEYGDVISEVDRLTIESQTELTASAMLKIQKANYYGGYGSATGAIYNVSNDDNIDHFDVYGVVGDFESIFDGGFYEDNEKGHRDAFLVYDGSNESDKDYFFFGDYTVNTEDEGQKPITYFLKANYKPETGLAPTFHALTKFNATNAAEAIEAEGNALVTAANGVITIKGTDAEATVYNAAGAVVYQGLDREIPATSGVYVVRIGGNVTKVVL